MYIDKIKSSFDLDAIKNSGLHFAYDAMYGAGQFVMKKLFPDMSFYTVNITHLLMDKLLSQ